jgi:hypothetical protein
MRVMPCESFYRELDLADAIELIADFLREAQTHIVDISSRIWQECYPPRVALP